MNRLAILMVVALGMALVVPVPSLAQVGATPMSDLRAESNQDARPSDTAGAASEVCISRSLGGKAAVEVSALPPISYEDLVLLVRTVRRSFAAKCSGKTERPASYCPPALKDTKAIVYVALRRHGRLLAEATSSEMQVVDAAAAAGALLAQDALKNEVRITGGGGDSGIELEVFGPRVYLENEYDVNATWSQALLHSFEPGVEGIGVEFQGRSGWTRPSEVITLNLTPDLAIQAAETTCGVKHIHKLRMAKKIRYFIFGAYHLWQADETKLPIVLHRGERLLPSTPPDLAELDAAIKRQGDYLHYRQNSDGWFSQQFLPSPNHYGEGNSAVVQMCAMLGLAEYAQWTRESKVLADVKKGLAKTSFFLLPLSRMVSAPKAEGEEPQFEDAGMALMFPGHEDYLEVTSLMLLSMLEMEPFWPGDEPIWRAPNAGDEATSQPATSQPDVKVPTVREAIVGLAECLVNTQRDDGAFFMPSKESPEATIVAQGGWVMLALAKAHASKTIAGEDSLRQRIERVLHRALQYYGPRLEKEFGPQTAAVVTRALVAAYAATNDARFSDAAFEVLDRFAALQVTPSACPWPELHGALNARVLGLVGVDTAAYLIPLAHGVLLAERVGDKKRAAVYRKTAAAAARFVLQLEVSEAGCFYIRNKRDALGGTRIALWDNRLRADNCATALESLLATRTALSGGEDGTRR